MQITKFTKYLFFLNGVSSLLGWNAVLTSLDYFNQVYSEYNVYGVLPIFVFIGYVIVGLTYNTLHKHITYKSLINIGFIILNVSLVLMLLLSIIFKNNPKTGFDLTIIITIIIGIGSNTYQLSFMAIMNFLSGQVVSLYTIGTAAGGLLIVFLRMIILAIKGSNSSNISAILIYYIVAIGINVFDQVLNLKFFASDTYLTKVLPHEHDHSQQSDTQGSVQGSTKNQSDQMKSNLTDDMPAEKTRKKNYYILLYEAVLDVNPNAILIFLNYVQTFMLFPNLSIQPLIQDSAWPVVILLFFYNLGDTAGKFFCNHRNLFNQNSIIYLLIARMYFFWSITGIIHFDEDSVMTSYAFIYINQFLFALSNGIITNGSFVLAFQKSSLQYKKYAGIACGLLLQLGILSGTLLAFPFDKLF